MAEQEIGKEKAQLVRDLKKRVRDEDEPSAAVSASAKADATNGEAQKKKARWGPQLSKEQQGKDWDVVDTQEISREPFASGLGDETPLGMVTPLVPGGAWSEGDKATRKKPRWDTGPVAVNDTVRVWGGS